MKLIIRLAINTLALFVVAYLVTGFILQDIWAAIVAAIVIGVINTLIKPVLQIIALPISILTFGISAFLINVALLYFTSFLVPGFKITNFLTAVFASLTLSIVSWFLGKLASE